MIRDEEKNEETTKKKKKKTAGWLFALPLTNLRRSLEVLDGRTEIVLVLVVEPPQLLQSLGVVLVVLQGLHVGVLGVLDLMIPQADASRVESIELHRIASSARKGRAGPGTHKT